MVKLPATVRNNGAFLEQLLIFLVIQKRPATERTLSILE